jgi:hypothetical protein
MLLTPLLLLLLLLLHSTTMKTKKEIDREDSSTKPYRTRERTG